MGSIKDRPRIKINKEKADYFITGAAWIAWLIMILIPTFYYADLPEKIPTHYNGMGDADAWGSKKEIITLPIIGSLIFFGIIILGRFPHILNYPVTITEENAEKQYRLISRLLNLVNACVTLSFAYISFSTVQNALGKMDGLGRWFLPVFLLFSFGPLIYYFYHIFKKQ